MKINVGSKNPNKVEAVREVLKDYPMFQNIEVFGMNVSSGVYKQPMSLEETREGAFNRAKNSFKGCDYGVGIESGLFFSKIPIPKYFNLCVCAIYDGMNFYEGLTSGFEYPDRVIKRLLENKLEINEAVFRCEITNSKKIGSEKGILNIFTNGRIDRKSYTKEAIRNALIKVENFEFR